MDNTEQSKHDIQAKQYDFPYHHIPHFNSEGYPTCSRVLRWGFSYLLYQKHIQEMIKGLKPSSLLDIGCGDGYLLSQVSPYCKHVVGVDLAERAILFAKAFNPDLDIFCMDAADLVESFDVVTAIEVLEHIPDDMTDGFFNVLADRLKQDGTLVMSVPTIVQKFSPKHYRHYTLELFRAQLEHSQAPLEIAGLEYIEKKSWIARKLLKRLHAKHWDMEVYPINRFIWRHLWKKHRYADAASGRHLVLTLKKSGSRFI